MSSLSSLRRPRLRTLSLWFFALILIATSALPLSTRAQIHLNLSSNKASASAAVVQTPRVRAELVAQVPNGIAAGQTFWLGLKLAHEPDWHTYWKNAGDSGLPTELNWQLPAGLSAGAIDWPTPHALRVGPLVNYGYENTVLLPIPVKVGSDFKAPESGMVDVRLSANWLICRVECIPESGEFALQIPVGGTTAANSEDFFKAQAQQPVALGDHSKASIQPDTQTQTQAGDNKVLDDRITLRVTGLPASTQGKALEFYPENAETFRHAAESGKDWQQRWDGNVWVAEGIHLSDMRGDTPKQLSIVVALSGKDRTEALNKAEPIAWRSTLNVEGQWTPATLASVSPALAAALEANKNAAVAPATPAPISSASNTGIWAALLGGLIGGLILNLMPCVFPVLAIKILGFAGHGQNCRAQKIGGLAYTAGVVLSFIALGALLLGLRAAGQQLGWGFQLQSPIVVSLLAALFTVLALNLAGLFEFGSMLPSRLASAQARSPVVDSFLSGVLAVAIASPCTAPFMGASLGFAIDMPAAQALTVFAALGVGMALPYLLASFVPAMVGWLPRPGAWMETFRRAMAFPMFATVVWLVWVLGHQSGMDAAAALLTLLLVLAALIWALGLNGKSRLALSAIALLLIAGVGYYAAPLITAPQPEPAHAQSGVGELWQPWSADKVQSLQAANQPVFVDFTAAWCVTCQVNKRTTLSNADVLAAFAQRKVALLRADWTRQDPAITEALHALGRSGVPVYVLYVPGKAPLVLSELLSKSEMLEALKTL
ncbi:thioredoxin family protein [Comamonas sp. Y33R10-2]|uniref:protein-disulfide reductase DsbD family protein n=1 Tax=Comamonas sp. Y33R10-2 TaxID=2853257 RepID=UPI001C5C862F|nr:thioredoxin family protein [Comamonas sp. Y33R10-2]QXZ08995.1 thioredoxin family protein [Comamonas sp. Y33R10-2]